MAGSGRTTRRRWPPRRAAEPGPARARRVAREGSGPWSWPWRHRRRRRRAFGCFLWLVTLLFVLLVLSVLFGGWRRGTATGSGPAHPAAVTATAAAVTGHAVVPGAGPE